MFVSMTAADLVPESTTDPLAVPAVGPVTYAPDAGWIVTRSAQVRAVLADARYEVPAVTAAGPVGSIGWLRAAVSRFANGPDHAVRRARVIEELNGLPADMLRADAEQRAHVLIDAAAGAGRIEVMSSLARQVPMAVLAARLGIADADRAAGAVRVTAAAYFPGASAAAERAADVSTAELVGMLGPAEEHAIVAKIAVMVQGCDATAALIGKAVSRVLPPVAGDHPVWPTEAIVAEVARFDSPLRVSRRVSTPGACLAGHRLPDCSVMLLHVDSANRDPEVFQAPEEFNPGRVDGNGLTFGYGIRPCPGQAQALALAAGVVQVVRDRCGAVIGPVEYEPSLSIRIPARVQVSIR
jgi:cytochrome P450